MKGETHIPVAIATTVLALQPQTIPECLCAIAGGAAGGLVCDLDNAGKRNSLDHSDDPYAWQFVVFGIVGLVIFLGLDYASGNGVIDFWKSHIGPIPIIGAVLFVVIGILGSRTPHRTFLHSLLACGLMTVALWYGCKPVALAFGIGFLSHICIDELNLIPVPFFWPLKKKKPWPWNRFPAAGKLNDALGAIAIVISICVCTYFCVSSFASSALYNKILMFFYQRIDILGKFELPCFVMYMVIINLVTFVLYLTDYFFYMNHIWYYGWSERTTEEMSSFIMTLLVLFDIAGGVIGKLLVVFITQKGEIRKGQNAANYNLYIIPISILVAWIAVLLTFGKLSIAFPKFSIANVTIQNISIRMIVLAYLGIISLVSFIVHLRTQQYASKVTAREKRNFIISLIGGAAGGYVAESISGNNKGSDIHGSLPFIVAAYAVVFACVVQAGIL